MAFAEQQVADILCDKEFVAFAEKYWNSINQFMETSRNYKNRSPRALRVEMTLAHIKTMSSFLPLEGVRRGIDAENSGSIVQILLEFCLCYDVHANLYSSFAEFRSAVVDTSGVTKC